MKQVFAVIDGTVLGIVAFENEQDAKAWASQNQEGGETLSYQVQAVPVYSDVASAPKNPAFF